MCAGFFDGSTRTKASTNPSGNPTSGLNLYPFISSKCFLLNLGRFGLQLTSPIFFPSRSHSSPLSRNFLQAGVSLSKHSISSKSMQVTPPFRCNGRADFFTFDVFPKAALTSAVVGLGGSTVQAPPLAPITSLPPPTACRSSGTDATSPHSCGRCNEAAPRP